MFPELVLRKPFKFYKMLHLLLWDVDVLLESSVSEFQSLHLFIDFPNNAHGLG